MSEAQNKAIISGGMGDIGRAVATALAAEGYGVCILYHATSKNEVDEFLATLPGAGHVALMCDMTNTAEVFESVAAANERLDGLDTVIHAAVSPLVRKKASTIPIAEFRQQFEVSLFGGLAIFQAAIPYLQRQRGGVIIGLTTTALEVGASRSAMAGYISAKHALRGLLRDLARELWPHGVRVHAVAPGFVATQLHRDLPPRALDFIAEAEPLKRLLTPEDVARTVVRACRDTRTGLSFPVGGDEEVPL